MEEQDTEETVDPLVSQLCQMMNGALEPKGITPENLAERVGSLIVSLEKALKKNHHYEELAKL